MKKHNKKQNPCCLLWQRAINSIDVVPTIQDEKFFLLASTVKDLLQWQLGSYCPTCGCKLSK